MKKVLVVVVLTMMLLTVAFGGTHPTKHQLTSATMSSHLGGAVDCGTLAGATFTAAALAGAGGITLLPALIGGIGLIVLC